jgi:hypothetical protein
MTIWSINTNLKYCKRFYTFYQGEIGQQPVDQFHNLSLFQIPWGHHIIILPSIEQIEFEFRNAE